MIVLVCFCLFNLLVFFFFKQKTAYEMRISDWSSDVCSSDLVDALILIGLTLLGGLQFLNWNLGRLIDNELLRQLALLASVLLILGALGLPFSLWRKFKLEARFGFNRVTPRLFVMDALKIGRASCRERVCQYV